MVTQDGGTPTANVTAPQGGTPEGQQVASEPLTWDTWVAAQDEVVKGLIDGHVKGLKSALDNERSQRSDLAKQLRDVTAKAEKGSELATALTQVSAQLEEAERRATFYADAGKPEIGCSNPRAAFVVAQADNLFDKRGNVDWAALKAVAPELFRPRVPQGNAGAGTGAPPPATQDMNQYIRRAAGR